MKLLGNTSNKIYAIIAVIIVFIHRFDGLRWGLTKLWIKTISVGNECQGVLISKLLAYKNAGASGVILDAYTPHQFGGTGKCFDWRLIPSNPPLPIILAGGLNADNVADALAQTHVWGVDVSGGIEWAKGRKCGEKMAKFIKNVQSKYATSV